MKISDEVLAELLRLARDEQTARFDADLAESVLTELQAAREVVEKAMKVNEMDEVLYAFHMTEALAEYRKSDRRVFTQSNKRKETAMCKEHYTLEQAQVELGELAKRLKQTTPLGPAWAHIVERCAETLRLQKMDASVAHDLVVAQSEQLTRIVNAIRGIPPENKLHSYHNAADMVVRIIKELVECRTAIRAVLNDHDERMKMYPRLEDAPARMQAMQKARRAYTGPTLIDWSTFRMAQLENPNVQKPGEGR